MSAIHKLWLSIFVVSVLPLVLPQRSDAQPQSARLVTPYVSIGNTHGYGGTDYYLRVGTAVTAGADVLLKSLGDNQFLVGAGITHRYYPQDYRAICYNAVRRPCATGFPEFNSAQIDLVWRRRFRRIDADFAVRPTLLRNDAGDIPTGNWLGASAGVMISRRIWQAWSVSLSTSGTYLSSYGGERLGLHENTIGLRFR
jgi:hypothetical protein